MRGGKEMERKSIRERMREGEKEHEGGREIEKGK